MHAFVPVTINDLRFDAAGISAHVKANGDVVVIHPLETITLTGLDAEAFLRWWDLRADIIVGPETEIE